MMSVTGKKESARGDGTGGGGGGGICVCNSYPCSEETFLAAFVCLFFFFFSALLGDRGRWVSVRLHPYLYIISGTGARK